MDMANTTTQLAILVTAVAGLITSLATMVYQFVREGRRHAWEVEAAERHAKAQAAAKAERDEISARVVEAERALNAKIDENTDISRQAFTEANHLNTKIAAQGDAFDKMLQAMFRADIDKEARVAAAAALAAEKVAAVTAATAADVAATVAASHDQLDEVASTTADTAVKVTEIRDKIVGDGDA